MHDLRTIPNHFESFTNHAEPSTHVDRSSVEDRSMIPDMRHIVINGSPNKEKHVVNCSGSSSSHGDFQSFRNPQFDKISMEPIGSAPNAPREPFFSESGKRAGQMLKFIARGNCVWNMMSSLTHASTAELPRNPHSR